MGRWLGGGELRGEREWTIVKKVDRKREGKTYWGQASIRLRGFGASSPKGFLLKILKVKLFFLIGRKHIISRMGSFVIVKAFDVFKKRKFKLSFVIKGFSV